MRAEFVKELELPLRVGDRALRSRLIYDSADPHTVTLAISKRGVEVPWEFDRELLRQGRFEQVGEGDVKIRPSQDHPSRVEILLSSPIGRMTFEASKDLITIFVVRIYTAVPDGREHEWIDWDLEIAALLEEKKS